MSKWSIYALIICQSVIMVWASDSRAQRSNLDEFEIHLDNDYKKTELNELFKEIESDTDFRFVYSKKHLKNTKINARSGVWNLKTLLESVANQGRFSIKRVNESISISPVLTESSKPTISEELTLLIGVTGTVTDENGEPLPGATVQVKGTQKGVITGVDGTFSLDVNEGDILVISFVGFITQEIKVGNRTQIDIQLEEDTSSLEEVVVIGYGQVDKRDITGSLSSVSSEQLKSLPLTSFDQGLQGRAAGVQVTQNSGQPGGAVSIRVRGGNSINAGNEPLYVIDGFPVYNENNSTQAGAITAPSQNVLASLNPNDIESIEILKDASATAIYGSRGANGVVLITTKRGKSGKGNVDIEWYNGIQEVSRILPVLNAQQYAEFRNEAFENGGGLPTYSDEEVAGFGEGTNWQNELFRQASIQNFQVGFSGGNEKSKYNISLNYFDQEGIIINSGFERVAARLNLDSEVNDRLRVGTSFSYSSTFSDVARTGAGISGTQNLQSPSGSVVASAIFYNPIIPVRDEDGNFTTDNASGTQGEGGGNQANVPFPNPIAVATLSTNENITNRLLGNVYAELDIIEGLKFRTSLGTDVINNKQNVYFPSTVPRLGSNTNGSAQVATVSSISWLSENTISYNKEFNQDNKLDVLAGFTIQGFEQENTFTFATNFTNDVLTFNNIGSGDIETQRAGTFFNDWSLVSYLFRTNYSLKDKYLFTITGRVDGSSRFGDDNKYAFFPSAAFAWRLGDEEFISALSLFSDLKLRTSVGVTGNQEIPLYQSLARLGFNNYTIGGAQLTGVSPITIGNDDLKWETTTQFDLGIDMSFLEGKVNLTTDFYIKKTSDLLLNVQLPRSSGFTQALQNIGEVENRGFELAINTVNWDSDFKWTTDFNIAFNRNEVLDLGQNTEILDDGGFSANNGFNLFKGRIVNVLREGEPVGNFFGFEDAGVFRDQSDVDNSPTQNGAAPGTRKYVDQNNDGVIDDNDRVIIGNALPDYVGGITNNFSYKNFDLSIFFQYSVGNDVYNLLQLESEFLNGRQNNSTTVLNRWTPENQDTDVARAHNPNNPHFRDSGSRYVEDASFLRLKNIVLGYNIDTEKVSWLRKARVYVSAQNLWTLTDYTGFDPEVNITQSSNTRLGFDYGTYPLAQSYIVGVNLGF